MPIPKILNTVPSLEFIKASFPPPTPVAEAVAATVDWITSDPAKNCTLVYSMNHKIMIKK